MTTLSCSYTQTSRDATLYDFDKISLTTRNEMTIANYNSEVDRYKRANRPKNVDEFVDYSKLDWSYHLKNFLQNGVYVVPRDHPIRKCLYRPFSKQNLFFDNVLINSLGLQHYFFPTPEIDKTNTAICITDKGSAKPFMVMMVDTLSDLHLVGAGASSQCFPFYVYDEDGSNRRENITDWALAQFRGHYDDESITKWDIFYYVYGLLHHPDYRERYADNLKRELPRIPFVPKDTGAKKSDGIHTVPTGNTEGSGFWIFSRAGKDLAESHLNYEDGKRYEGIEWQTNSEVKPSYRVQKMRPRGKRDAEDGNYKVYDSLKVNEYLTLTGIPEEAFAYRLGNRSAIDWIVDQYRVKTDKRSGITSDPNGYSDDEQYIVKLVERVVQVSVDTVAIVNRLAEVDFREGE